MPDDRRWLPKSEHFSQTTDVDPDPVQLGASTTTADRASRKGWWGTVIGFPTKSLTTLQGEAA
jgi:hypothetical protein